VTERQQRYSSSADVASLAAGLGTALHAAGLPVGPDRCERLARAVTVMGVRTIRDLHACALATMVSDPGQVTTFERVFAALFYGTAGSISSASATVPQQKDDQTQEGASQDSASQDGASQDSAGQDGASLKESLLRQVTTDATGPDGSPDEEASGVFRMASAAERLRSRDFTKLSADELLLLGTLMREMTLAIPPRRTRRYRRARDGKRPDLRGTLRQARRSGGEPVTFARRAPRSRPRRLVVLCDISGSMEPYARALLMLLYCMKAGAGNTGASSTRAEVFSFATRLTRLTATLRAATPDTMLAKAGAAAPDWSGGTRIGAAVKEFNDRYGCRGMARGAVILIISDGWETGDPALLGAQLARLHRVAHRIVWANPRTQSPRYRPEVGGMAAAWPYCDAVVSAHNLDALPDLLAALAGGALAGGALAGGGLAGPGLAGKSLRRPLPRSCGSRWRRWVLSGA
jgi:uncharacterized protein with von Willebrand factor type A (vWA) domain